MNAVAGASVAAARRANARGQYHASSGWLLASPAALLLGLLILLPTLTVVVLAFFDWDLAANAMHFVGLTNFTELLHDDAFWASVRNTLLYVVIVTPTTLILAMLLALLIEGDRGFRTAYRALHLLPVFAAFPAVAMAWEVLLHPTIGPLNEFLRLLGYAPRNWLRDQAVVLPTLMVIGVWHHLGIAVVLLIGALKSIPQELYDAVELDGAKRSIDRFFLVTLPGLGPVALFVTILITLRALETFDAPRVLTQGGPGTSSETLLHTLFVESFVYLRTGFGAALTVVFLSLAGTLALVRRTLDRKVHYT